MCDVAERSNARPWWMWLRRRHHSSFPASDQGVLGSLHTAKHTQTHSACRVSHWQGSTASTRTLILIHTYICMYVYLYMCVCVYCSRANFFCLGFLLLFLFCILTSTFASNEVNLPAIKPARVFILVTQPGDYFHHSQRHFHYQNPVTLLSAQSLQAPFFHCCFCNLNRKENGDRNRV